MKTGLQALTILLLAFISSCTSDPADNSKPMLTDEAEVSYYEFAVDFAKALTADDFVSAHAMLAPDLKAEYSVDALKASFEEMVEYGGSPARVDGFVEVMDDWPTKGSADLGWAYVSISGADFAEAVTVVVTRVDDAMAIGSIEWGRP